MIHFNKPEFAKERLKNKIPTLEEIQQVANKFNYATLDFEDLMIIKRIFYDYENLRHFRSYLVGNKLHDGTVIKFGETV